MAKYQITNKDGSKSEIDVELEDYKIAGEQGDSLSQHLQKKFPDADPERGTVMEQCMASSGLFVQSDPSQGIKAPTMKTVLDGTHQVATGSLTRGDGSGTTPSSRLLFPEIILQLVTADLPSDGITPFVSSFESVIAQTDTVTSPKIDIPVIDTSAPRDTESQSIAQNAEPDRMIGISTSDKILRIPTKSIGLSITDEAQSATSIDLVNLVIQEQALAERERSYEAYLSQMVEGDADLGITALAGNNADTYDATIAADGELTHRGWVKYLYNPTQSRTRNRRITAGFANLDTILDIQGRTGRPERQNDKGTDNRINPDITIDDLGLNDVRIIPVRDGLLAAHRFAGIDQRYAMRRVINAAASYSAVEQFVLRRASAMRIDFGVIVTRLYDDAWHNLDLLNT